jgi:hypothetical protein
MRAAIVMVTDKSVIVEPLAKWPFQPNSALCEKFLYALILNEKFHFAKSSVVTRGYLTGR